MNQYCFEPDWSEIKQLVISCSGNPIIGYFILRTEVIASQSPLDPFPNPIDTVGKGKGKEKRGGDRTEQMWSETRPD